MKDSAICPNCSDIMLHHFGNHREYWFCRSCWQEMPNLQVMKENQCLFQKRILYLSTNLIKTNKTILV